MDSYVELGHPDNFVIGWWLEPIQRWFALGFVEVPDEGVWEALHYAMLDVRPDDVAGIWKIVFDEPPPQRATVSNLRDALHSRSRGPCKSVTILQQRVIRDQFYAPSPPPLKQVAHPPRTTTDHYVVIEAVDDQEQPVRGVRIEVLIADGEIKGAQTGEDGIARVERIHAGRVVIRVLGLDGAFWAALDGDPARPSAQEPGFLWHEVKRGECLSKIAHQHGIKGWKNLWQHPKNEPLRKKRKSPHVLWPGDLVAVPRVEVYEIVRATDASYRIQVKRGARLHLRMMLHDFNGIPFDNEKYELYRPGETTPLHGSTDGTGMLEIDVPMSTPHVVVRCPELHLAWQFELGALEPYSGGDPVPMPSNQAKTMPENSTVPGLQARLSALGYHAGPATGQWNERTEAALARFQRAELGAPEGTLGTWSSEADLALGERKGA